MFNTVGQIVESIIMIIEFIITIVTTGVSIAVYKKTRRMEKKLFAETKHSSIRQESNAIVVFDLISASPEDLLKQALNSIDSDEKLKDAMHETIIDAPALENCDSIPAVLPGGFNIGYSFTNAQDKTGRIVTVGGKDLPTSTEQAEIYQRNLAKCMSELSKKLRAGGVGTIHVFFRGSTTAAFYVGECFDNSFKALMYHYWNGKYFYYPMDAPNKSTENKQQNKALPKESK